MFYSVQNILLNKVSVEQKWLLIHSFTSGKHH